LKFKKRFALTAGGLFLDAMYNFGRNYNENIQSAFDLDEQTGEYTLFNTDLSTDFRFTDLTSIPGIGFTFQKSKWNINVSASYVSRTLKNEDALRPEVSLERSFDAMEAGVGIRWNNMGKNLSFNYGLRNSPPSLNQLQPFEDISNPLNRVTGNPDLSPTITHRFDMFYRAGQFQKGRMFNLVLTGSFINDKVISQTIVDDNLLSNTTFTNVSGDYSVMTRASYIDRITFDKKRKLNYTFSMMSLLNRTVNFNNDVQYSLLNTTLIPSVNLHFEWNDLFEFRSSYRISLTRSEFDLDIFENTEFVTHDMRISWISTFPKRLQWNNVLTYNFNPQVGDGFQRSTWLLNSTLTYQVFKDQGEITLTMYDLLNQNTNVRRIANANFIEDVSNTVLTQYAMLGFTWRFNGGAKRPSLGQLF